MNLCDISQVPQGLKRRGLGRETTQSERFRQEKIQRFDSDYRIKARSHSVGRNEAVSELLCYLSLLRNAKAIPEHAVLAWDRAHYQAFRASEGRNAAHVLPCQLLIDGANPTGLAVPPFLDGNKIRYALAELFGKVTSLPKVFNVSDSRAEDHCLRGAFVQACEYVIGHTQPIHRQAGVLKRGVGLNYGEIQLSVNDRPAAASVGIDHGAVRTAYEIWNQGARAAFGRAIAAVEAKGATVDGQDASDEVIYVLEQYRANLTQLPAKMTDPMMFRLEESLWI